MTKFTDSTVMEEVLIKFWFFKGTIIVLLTEFVDREAMLSRIGLQNMGKVSCLCLRGNSNTIWAVSGQPCLGVQVVITLSVLMISSPGNGGGWSIIRVVG